MERATPLRNGVLAWAVASSVAMGFGFWLKWRLLLVPDPIGWFLFSWGRMSYSDLVGLYLRDRLWSHPIPYLQTRLEYPVVVGIFQYLAAWAPGVGGYFLVSSSLLAATGVGTLWAIRRIDPEAPLWIFAATPPILLYGAMNWDLLAILFLLTSMLLFARSRDGWSALFLSMGIWTKLFPVAVLPWMLAARIREGRWRSVSLIVAVIIAVSAVLNLPFYLASPEGWLYTLRFHAARPPDGGSIWAHIPGLPLSWVNRGSFLLGAAGAAWAAALAYRSDMGVGKPALVALACLFLTLKITSPQYDLWIVPFLALGAAPVWLVGLFAVVDLAYCWTSFQALYVAGGGHGMLGGMQPLVVWISIWSHQLALLLVLLWAVGLTRWRKAHS